MGNDSNSNSLNQLFPRRRTLMQFYIRNKMEIVKDIYGIYHFQKSLFSGMILFQKISGIL